MGRLLYACVSRETVVICSFQSKGCPKLESPLPVDRDTLEAVLRKQINQGLPEDRCQIIPHRLGPFWNRDYLKQHFLVEPPIVYMLLADSRVLDETAAGFLLKLQQDFLKTFSIRDARGEVKPNSLQDVFGPTLEYHVKFCEEHQRQVAVVGMIPSTKVVLKEKVMRILNRGGSLDDLKKKSEEIRDLEDEYNAKVKHIAMSRTWAHLGLVALVLVVLMLTGVAVWLILQALLP